jgi:5-methylcytosine-specific restriction protein A
MPRRPDDWVLGTKDWKDMRQVVLDRDHHVCQIRGPHCTTRATAVDHIHPRSQGGGHDLANLRAACVACNSRGAAYITAAVRRGTTLGARSRRW